MLLDTHLKARGLTDKEFASMIGCERSFVTRLRNGESHASFTILQKIEQATDGQVTAVDVYQARKARLAVRPVKKSRRKARLHAAE